MYSLKRSILFAFILFPFIALAQKEEVLLTFRHPALGHIYVNSLYDSQTNETFLPLIEIFSRFEINYTADSKSYTVKGKYLTQGEDYTVNLQTLHIILGQNDFVIKPEDFRIGETDYFLSPSLFEKIFGLNFTVDISNLILTLETKHKLPIEERINREKTRSRMEGTQQLKENFPMAYDRKRSILNGGMIDYSIVGSHSDGNQDFGYNLTGGIELLGGDLQGTVTGNQASNGFNSFITNGLRWRYALRDNDLISGIMLGQASTTGLQPIPYRGISLTNDPIEPRSIYETYVIDGTTEPESEVEIYVNERIADYKRANELGYYRFDVPITYGTTRISTRIFTPSGEIIVSDKQIQVPFTFLPAGVVSYNIQAGKTEYWADTLQNQTVAHGNVALGINRWLTASVGAQHLGLKFVPNELFYYGSISARIAKQYLMNLDIAPDAYYRLTGSVMYPSNTNISFYLTQYNGISIFNARRAKQDFSANVFVPFKVFKLSSGFRIGGEHYIFQGSNSTRYLADFNMRLGRANLRLNYRDNLVRINRSSYYGEGLLTTALTYTLARSPGIPVYVRGMFVRGQILYDVHRQQLQATEFQLSRTVFATGRLNLIAAYNYATRSINSQLGLSIDLNKVRSTSTVSSNDNKVSLRQSMSGSIGWDNSNKHINLSDRQQTGKSAASVLLFIDNNNSGKYDAGDELLPYKGVKIDRSTNMKVGRDSILRLNQLQPYYLYNLSVNRSAIPDPTLVPLKDEFSFVADPNQYKRIEIPFYRGGTIDGMILIDRDGKQAGQGNLRLILKSSGKAFEQNILTFNDGSFYCMDLPPGNYTLEVDPAQLQFLNVKQNKKLEFEIKALAEGVQLEGLKIILTPDNQ